MKAGRYQVRITRSGFIFIGLTIALGVGAANTGNNLLYLMASLMLALMLLSGLSSLANLRGLDLSLHLPEEVFAGLPARADLHVRKRWGSGFFLRFETPYGRMFLPFVRGRARVPLWLTFPRRGRIRVGTVAIRSGFPLGFFQRLHVRRLGVVTTVYPTPVFEPMPPLEGTAGESDSRQGVLGEPGDGVIGFREYRAGDPLKRVDWKATARRARMMVREADRRTGDTLMIDLSGFRSPAETALSKTCHLVLEAFRLDLRVGLILPDRVVPPERGRAQKREILEVLSAA